MKNRTKKADAKASDKLAVLAAKDADLGKMITDSAAMSAMNKFKGKADVDERFGMRSLWMVYEDASGNKYSAYLNKSELGDNQNKFYILQLLQHTHLSGSVGIFTRYGRVGVPGV